MSARWSESISNLEVLQAIRERPGLGLVARADVTFRAFGSFDVIGPLAVIEHVKTMVEHYASAATSRAQRDLLLPTSAFMVL
jgi:hypothetical protein